VKAIGIIFVVLALAIGVVPQFTNCSAQGRSLDLANGRTIPMKCYWTAQAELAVAVPLLLVGGFVALSRRKEAQRALSSVGALLGVFAILLPTSLIGVCASDEMLCNILMKPTLVFSGVVAVMAGLLGLVLAGREQPRLFAGKPS
jgi:protein-S-isoprenylcysteine O-methyltransferase Ste14